MTMTRSSVLNYVLPILAIITLTILLIITLLRLSDIQRDMRNNYHANMVWVLYQTHTESLILNDAIQQKISDPQAMVDLSLRYKILLSRINLLDDGPQARALQEIDADHAIGQYVAIIQNIGSLINATNINLQDAQQIRQTLTAFNTLLTSMSTKAMVAQWEEAGARLDLYRNAVLTVFFLMIGILLSSAFISIQLLLALKSAKENERVKQREIVLTKELESERKISDLHRSFGAMVSHQFRTPLAIIDANMQRLIRAGNRMDAAEVARRAEKVRTATQRLTGLIESILHADRLMEQLSVSMQPYSLADLAMQVIAEQRALTSARLILFSDDAQSASSVECDPVLTAQILSNFLSNAINYSSHDTLIRVRVYRDSSWVCCDVQDHGRGIPVEDLPHIFQRYFRARSTVDVIGTGIGLHIASELASLQGGEIIVHSELGRGSTFTLRLPHSKNACVVLDESLMGKEAI